MNARRIFLGGVVAAMCLLGQRARAGEETGYQTIVDIGCHSYNGVCYVTLSGGSTFGANEPCRAGLGATNQARWDNADQPSGQRTFAALYGAFLAGRKVMLYIAGCAAGTFPGFAYYHVQ